LNAVQGVSDSLRFSNEEQARIIGALEFEINSRIREYGILKDQHRQLEQDNYATAQKNKRLESKVDEQGSEIRSITTKLNSVNTRIGTLSESYSQLLITHATTEDEKKRIEGNVSDMTLTLNAKGQQVYAVETTAEEYKRRAITAEKLNEEYVRTISEKDIQLASQERRFIEQENTYQQKLEALYRRANSTHDLIESVQVRFKGLKLLTDGSGNGRK
jgi:chromosome segregation ATPase